MRVNSLLSQWWFLKPSAINHLLSFRSVSLLTQSFWVTCCAFHQPPFVVFFWLDLGIASSFLRRSHPLFNCVEIWEAKVASTVSVLWVWTPSLKHCVCVVTARDLVAEGRPGRFWGSSAAPEPCLVGSLVCYGEDVDYQDQLWTSCMVGHVFGYLQQTSCRVWGTEQSVSYLIFFFFCKPPFEFQPKLLHRWFVLLYLSFFAPKENLNFAVVAKPLPFCLMGEVILLTFPCTIWVSHNLSWTL